MAEFAGDAHPGCLVRPHVRAATSRTRCSAVQEEAARPPASPARTRTRARARARRSKQGGEGRQDGGRRPIAGRDQDGDQGPAEGAHPRQPAGAGPVRRGRRRPVPDRQPAAGGGAAAGARGTPGACRPTRSGTWSRTSSAPTRPASAPTAGSCWSGSRIVDMARKVVGVGSVGTRAWMVLLRGPRHRRPAVPAGQGGHPVGAGGPPAEEPVQHPRPTGGRRPAADAGHLRHLPRLDQGRPGRPLLLLAPAPRHEGLRGRRDHDPVRDDLLRPDVRLDPRPRPRPLR